LYNTSTAYQLVSKWWWICTNNFDIEPQS